MGTPPVKTFLRAAFLLVLPTVVVCVLALELGLRLQGRLPSNQTEGIFEAHGEAYRLKRNQTKVFRTPSFACTIHTNALGLRDRAPGPRPLARPYIAWLGDSATFANGVDYEDSFVGRFGALAERRGLEMVNLAVGGHHLGEQEDLLQDFLAAAPRPPERVVAVFTPQLLALFEKRHRNLVFKNGYGFPRDAWLKPYLLVTLGDASSAYGFFRDGIRRVQGKLFPRGAEAAAEMLDIYARSYPAATPEATRRLEERLTALAGRIRAAGAVPVNVYLPTSADLRATELVAISGRSPDAYDFDRWREVVRRASALAGAQFVDLTETLRAEHARGIPLGFMQDMHYNVAAHVPIAQALFRELMDTVSAAPSPAGRTPPLRPVPASTSGR
jgi:hypothetical protein